MALERLYTLAETEEATGIKLETLRLKIKQGEIKAAKIAGKWRVKEKDLQDYFDKCKQSGAND